MHNGVTRRGVLQLFAALTAAVPVLTRGASAPLLPSGAPSPEKPAAELVGGPSRPTLLESYLRSRGVRPAHLARECGYERAHLLRIRMGRTEPTPACAVGIVYGLRRLVGEPVVLTDVFPRAIAEAAWRERRAIVRTFHPFEHRAVRAVFREGGRRG
ncbi:MAG TPA: hypothetical protein VNA69_10030 [Thermoanaerobaculia bacterium]|nr:hypothetical protein [Thermoanaerobaculia bacterium]